MSKNHGLEKLKNGNSLNIKELIILTLQLSIPAIMAQVSTIIMQYADASMVGRLGANDSASIGLISSTTWLFGGLISALSIGFNVQIAHSIGAKEEARARNLVKEGLLTAIVFSAILCLIGVSIHSYLPIWLGGNSDIVKNASVYFLVYSLALPIQQFNNMGAGMLQCSGDMKTPSSLQILMCFLNIIFNFFFIFPSGVYSFLNIHMNLPGLGLGILGAAIATALAQCCSMIGMMFVLLFRSELLALRSYEKFVLNVKDITQAIVLAIPVALEQVVTCGAQILQTRIVAPLGTISIAANSFSVTAEGLCYMPGYGIASAATTLIGQSIGAKRQDLTKKIGILIVVIGMFVMTISGTLMYIFAPNMLALLSPDKDIQALGTLVLRIEAYAEPFFAASIVATGVFRGAKDTVIPSLFNLISMWLIRIPLAAYLAPRIGLKGVWWAMAIELTVRGLLFLVRLFVKPWHRKESI